MKAEIAPKEFSVKEVFFQLRYYILAFLGGLFLLSFVMSRLHPKVPSYAKEYNYLYSMGAAMEKGREISLDRFDEKLTDFSEMRPEFDRLLAKNYISNQEFEKVGSLITAVRKRLPVKNKITENFTNASLEIEKKNYKEAYALALKLKANEICKENFPMVFAYNLYRTLVLEQILGYQEEALATKEKLGSFIKEDASGKFSEDVIMKKILKLLEL